MKNFLGILMHVDPSKPLITFIQDKVFKMFKVEALISSKDEDAAKGPHDDMQAVLLQHLFNLLNRQTTKKTT